MYECSNLAALANASRGWRQMRSGFELEALAANSPAMTAEAPEFNAEARVDSVSANTRSPLRAELMLATPFSATVALPTTSAAIRGASAATVCVMSNVV
jgi:hypothetical protein